MLNKLLRLLLVAGIVTGSALWAVPAGANHFSVQFHECPTDPDEELEDPLTTPSPTPSPEPTPTPENCMPPEGEIIRETRTLRFSVAPWSPIEALRPELVTVSVVPDEDGLQTPAATLATWRRSEGELPSNGVFDFAWNSPVRTPLNGRYKIRVIAQSGGQNHAEAERVDLIVDNHPVAPQAPAITRATRSAITLEWPRNPEADLIGYILYRAESTGSDAPNASKLEAIALPTEESYVDEDVEEGKSYRYALRALRRSLVFERGIWSPRGPMSGTTALTTAAPEQQQQVEQEDRRPRTRRAQAPAPRRAPVRDAPFDLELPYDENNAVRGAPPVIQEATEAGVDPRGAVLPVAVGAFLVSAALAFGRMPY